MTLPIFLLGLCAGSFLNVVILRLRKDESIWRGRSHCPHCQKVLQWHELVPILSFLCQGGRCRGCRAPLSWQYPLVELATGFLFIFPILHNSSFLIPNFILYWLLISFLVAIFVYDLKYGEVPDIFIYIPSIILIIVNLLNFFGILNFTWFLSPGYRNLFLGVFIGAGFFGVQFLISRGRWIGAGDVGLGVLMGLILGWQNLLVAFFLAYVGGAIISLFWLILHKKTLKSTVPFGIFLVPATFIAMFWGETIIRWYLGKIFS